MSRHVKIVLPCINEGEWLRVTVESILEHTRYPSFEVFILANGDEVTDFSFVEKPAFRRRVRLERVEKRLGMGNCLNAAVRPGDAVYYVFLDAHCLLEQHDWIQRAVACLEDHPEASYVQPEVENFHFDEPVAPGASVDPTRLLRKDFWYSVRWAWPYESPQDVIDVEQSPASDRAYEGMAGAGMAAFLHAGTFHRLGGFEREVSGWFYEAMDYCLRAWMLGHPMLVEPAVRVLHRHKGFEKRYPLRYQDLVHSVLRTAWKYLSPRRRDLAEVLFRGHGLDAEVDLALEKIEAGSWLEERARHLRERVRDDDWLFERFDIYEAPLE